MNQLVISLIVLLVPGVIAALIYDAITQHKEWTNFTFSITAIVFGWFSYLPLYLFNALFAYCGFPFHFSIFETLIRLLNGDKIGSAIYIDIITASIFSIFIAAIASACDNYKIFTRIARYCKISNKYGDENLFSYFLNSNEIDWVYIRAKTQGYTYLGVVLTHSETRDIQEIALGNVDIYDYETSAFLYHSDSLYLCGKAGDFVIELAGQKGETDGRTHNTAD